MRYANVKSSNQESLTEKAYLAIRNQILHGKLALGTVLSRRRLATDLGMSMLPICAAIQRLENEGLVESQPRVGTRVRIPTEQDIRERHTIREGLESQAARLVAEKATMQQRQELVRMAEQLDALFRRITTENGTDFLFAVHGYHMQLHLKIAEFSGVPALRELIEKNNVLIMNWLYNLATPGPSPRSRFHADLVDVITGRDVEAAERALRAHIQSREEDTIHTVEHARTSPASRWRLRESPAGESIPLQTHASIDRPLNRAFQRATLSSLSF
jgi:GntR family transcriptional regulator, rspAB operon transcriptional repressor